MAAVLPIELSLIRFEAVPAILINDPQLGRVYANPFGLIVESTVRSPRFRVGLKDLFSPADHADVALVVQDSGLAVPITVYRAWVPLPPSRPWDAFGIQSNGDGTRRDAFQIFPEDPPHDLGLVLIDAPNSANAFTLRVGLRLDVVAIRLPAAALAFQHAALNAPTRFVREVCDKKLAEQSGRGKVHLLDFTLSERDHSRISPSKVTMHSGDVREIAAQAIEGFREYDLNFFPLHVGEHFLQAWAEEIGACFRLVGILADNRPALTLRALAAKPELIVNRSLGLIFTAETGIEGDGRHGLLLVASIIAQDGARAAKILVILHSRHAGQCLDEPDKLRSKTCYFPCNSAFAIIRCIYGYSIHCGFSVFLLDTITTNHIFYLNLLRNIGVFNSIKT